MLTGTVDLATPESELLLCCMQRLPTPKRVFERQESRSRHSGSDVSGSPKMSLAPNVLTTSDSFKSGEPGSR